MSGGPDGTSGSGERDLALAVRRAVEDDDGAWSAERLSAVAERAAGRAARRRRRRLVVAPVAVLAAAAAVAAGVVVVPSLVAAERAAPTAASRPPSPGPTSPAPWLADAAVTSAAEEAGHLSTAEVQWVLPGAQAQVQFKGRPGWVTEPDACGTADLDVPAPVADRRGTWSLWTPDASSVESAPDRVSPWLTSRVATYADAAQATEYVEALDASTRTCTPAEGESRPTNPQTFDIRYADAVYGSAVDSAPGQYLVTAAMRSGAQVAVVSALVDLTAGPEHDPAEVWVAQDLARLATAAAARADGQPGADAPLDLARTPATTSDVDAVLPGALPSAPYTARLSLDQQPRDACGTEPLTGVEAPSQVQRGAWFDPAIGYVEFLIGGARPTAQGTAALVVITSDFGSPAQARAYADAYQRSASTCDAGRGVRPPAPAGEELQGTADVLLTTGYASTVQRYGYDAVVVRGSTAATVLASVPGDSSAASAEQAAQRVVDLATTAADRAAADAASTP